MTIEDIEDQILLHSNSAEEKDIAHCQAYLELRKKLLDEEFINHLDEHLSEVADFNDRMMTALRTLWEDAQKCFDISKSMDGFDIEIRAYLELDAKEDDNEKKWFEIYCLHYHIKPQPNTARQATSHSCISFDSYIKPQLNEYHQRHGRVVYLLIPTSNHN